MDKFILIFAGILLAAAIAIVIIDRIRMRKLVNNLTEMLDNAIKGEVKETSFDESMNSLLETKLAEYLSNSSLSAKRVEEEKDKIKSLISDISHQTKTPIANLILYSELLDEEDIPQSAKEKVASIRSQSEKLKFLIEALVKMSRLENGIISLSPLPCEIDEIISDVCSQLKPKADEKGLKLTCEETTSKVKCDPKWTYEALHNIIDNAIKYTNEGEVSVSVNEFEMFVKIDIKDTGIGISQEDQTKVFGRFSRGSDSSQKEGVGIGLFLAREIVMGQGGYISLKSELGKGSCFSVFLPRA